MISSAAHSATMTNTEVSNMDECERRNGHRGSPRYNREKYNMYSTEPNLLHPHMQENLVLMPEITRSPSPKSDHMSNYNNNGFMVS